jgi:hypothetical protein
MLNASPQRELYLLSLRPLPLPRARLLLLTAVSVAFKRDLALAHVAFYSGAHRVLRVLDWQHGAACQRRAGVPARNMLKRSDARCSVPRFARHRH